ncbi:MAG: hypothetical protein U0V74_06535 [Chitinophagales bacterium]
MKYILLSCCLLTQIVYAGTKGSAPTNSVDTRTTDNNAKTTDIRLVPEANVLFFNQDYAFKVEGSSKYTVQSVRMDMATCPLMKENNFDLAVWWTNGEEKTVTLEVKVTDENGSELVLERKVLLQQKLPSPYLDNTLYKLDEKVIDTDLGLQKDDLLKASKLQFNTQDFTIRNVKLTSFKLRVGDKVYSSPDGTITQEMKEAINSTKVDDVIKLEDVQGTYKSIGDEMKFDLHYKSTYKIVLAG